ncbi:MAG: TolC family protein [Desulfobacterales bacterium]|nr:TolC family protein [Desulfobacterales bacterium]
MKNKKKMKLTLLMIILLSFIACSKHNKFAYNSVREEYPHLLCRENVSNSLTTFEGACSLNKPIFLTEAINIAIKNNPDVQMAYARINRTQAMLDQANSLFMPYIGLYSSYMQGDAPSAYLFKKIDQRMLQTNNFNDPGWFENFESGGKVMVNLFNGGKNIIDKKKAKNGLEISILDKQSVENELISSLTQTYYDYFAAQEYIKISEESVETVLAQLKVMKVKFEGGGALKSDILSLEVRLAEAKEEVVKSKNRLKMIHAAFANLIGVSPDTEITIIKEDIKSFKVPELYSEGMIYALENRPELESVKKQVVMARMEIESAKTQYLPKINLQGNYYYDDPDMQYSNSRKNWTVGFQMDWDLFTGFSTKAETKKALAMLEEAFGANRKVLLGIRLDVKNSYLKKEEAEERQKVAKQSVVMAEESLSLVKKQYEGGSVSVTRYLEAELAKNTSMIRATASFYDREKSIADIARAIGFLGKTFNQTLGK